MAYADREDQRAYGREHYKQNKDLYKERAKESNKKARAKRVRLIRELKESTPCTDCGVSYPYWVMDFDHLEDKEANIGRLASNGSMKKLVAEIEKCEIVCANCHRDRTHARLLEPVDKTGSNPVA